MAISKIDYAGNTLIDLTSDTVTTATLAEGVTAHSANGEKITGTLTVPNMGAISVHTVTEDCANAAQVANYFRNLRPDGCNDILVMFKPPSGVTGISEITERQMLTMTIRGNSTVAYSRWYNDTISASTTATTAYALRCWVGDEYYILPLM